ncbi:hypothetical protein QQ045_030132 [Rhodiola kirilowii]
MAAAQDDRSGACEPERVRVRVRNFSGLRVTIEARLEGSVEELKGLIAEECNVPVGQQKLIHKGRILENDRSIGSYGIQEGHTIQMISGSASTRTVSTPENAPVATDEDSSDPAGYTNAESSDFAGYAEADPSDFTGYPEADSSDFAGYAEADSSDPIGYTNADSNDFAGFTNADSSDPADYTNADSGDFTVYTNADSSDFTGFTNADSKTHRLPEDVSFSSVLMRSFILRIPRVQEIIDRDPRIRLVLYNTRFLRESFEISRSPEVMREWLYSTGRHLRDIESSSEGQNILRRLYEDFGDPIMNEVTTSVGNEDDIASDPSTSQLTPHDGTNNPSNLSSESASMISTINTEPLPWANSAARSCPQNLYPEPMVPSAHATGQSSNDMMSSDISNLQQATEQLQNSSVVSQQSPSPLHNQQLSPLETAYNHSRNVPSNPDVPTEELYATQLSQLHEMGFLDTQENIRALQATGGNMLTALEQLCRNMSR